MDFDNLTEQDLQTLRDIPKRKKEETGSQERQSSLHKSYTLSSDICYFEVFTRQNQLNPESYSAGIMVIGFHGKGPRIMLSRYNGSDHDHGEFIKACHVHHTTADSQHEEKPESGRVVRGNYKNLQDALECLIQEYNISDI